MSRANQDPHEELRAILFDLDTGSVTVEQAEIELLAWANYWSCGCM